MSALTSQMYYDSRIVHLPVMSSQKPLDVHQADAVLMTLAQEKVRAIEILPDHDLDKAKKVIKELDHLKDKVKKVGAASGKATGLAVDPERSSVLAEKRQSIIHSVRNMYKAVALRLLDRYLEGTSVDIADEMQKRMNIKENLVVSNQNTWIEKKEVENLAKGILENIRKHLISQLMAPEKSKKGSHHARKHQQKSGNQELKHRDMAFNKDDINTMIEPLKEVCKAIKSKSPDKLIRLGFKQEYESKRLSHEQHILEDYIKNEFVRTHDLEKATQAEIRRLEQANEDLKRHNEELEQRLNRQEVFITGLMSVANKKTEGGGSSFR